MFMHILTFSVTLKANNENLLTVNPLTIYEDYFPYNTLCMSGTKVLLAYSTAAQSPNTIPIENLRKHFETEDNKLF